MISKNNSYHKNLTQICNRNKIKLVLFLLEVKASDKNRKCACEYMRSIPAERLHSHLVNEQDTTGPSPGPAQNFFLMFGETGRAPDKCICPLGKVY